jgi:membrane fusion protein (multidrug efflux system)
MATETMEFEQLEKDAAKPLAPPPARKPAVKWIVIGAVLLIAIAGGWYLMATANRVSTDDAQVDGHIAPVAAKVYGNVLEVLVNDNQQVKKGEVLVRIDPRDYQAKVDVARAALQYAQSQLGGADITVPLTRDVTVSSSSQADAQLQSAEADLAKAASEHQRAAGADISFARANVDAGQATWDRAKADLERMRPLMEKSEISKLQFDSYVAAARVAESQLAAAKEKLSAALEDAETKKAALAGARARVAQAQAGVIQAKANQQQIGVQSARAASASAAVVQARADLETAELQLGYTTIVAPLDGMVTRKSVEPGQILQPGQSLMTIVPLNDIWVTANFKETQLRNVRPGQKAEVSVDMSGRSFPGHVDSIAASTGARMSLLPPENATGNFVKVVQRIPVKIVLDPLPADAILRPGMNVDAVIYTDSGRTSPGETK